MLTQRSRAKCLFKFTILLSLSFQMHSVPLLAFYMHLDEHIETLQDAIHSFESNNPFWTQQKKKYFDRHDFLQWDNLLNCRWFCFLGKDQSGFTVIDFDDCLTCWFLFRFFSLAVFPSHTLWRHLIIGGAKWILFTETDQFEWKFVRILIKIKQNVTNKPTAK